MAPVNWSMVRQLIVFGDCGVWMVSDLMMLELRVMSASVFATGMVRAWVLMLELESACCSCEVPRPSECCGFDSRACRGR